MKYIYFYLLLTVQLILFNFEVTGAVRLISFLSCSRAPVPHYSVKFIARLKKSAIAPQVYLTGNNEKLGNWNPAAVPMIQESDSLWSTTLSFREGESIEYKVTAGSWLLEALDKNETTYSNFRLKVNSDTIVTIDVYDWLIRMKNGKLIFDAKSLTPKRPDLSLVGLWRYHSGDSAAWADPMYNDSAWVVTNPYIRWTQSSDPQWDGLGWFRFHFYVDSALWNRTLAISILQLGASQIYYNGRLLYSFGKIGSSASTTEPNNMSWWQEFKIDPQYDQLLAVRYANYDWKRLLKMGYFPGFVISLKDVNTAFKTAVRVRINAVRQIVFTWIPLILFFLHLSLYGFLRKQRQNLFYAICMLGIAGVTYFNYEKTLVVNVSTIILFTKLNSLSVVVASLFGLLTIYEYYTKFPKRIWAYLILFSFIALAILFNLDAKFISIASYLFIGILVLEGFFAAFSKRTRPFYGGWIMLVGFFVLSIFVILQFLIDFAVISGLFGLTQVYVYGMIGLAIATSISLSYNFARVNKDLEVQLHNVKQLSEKNIEQERIAHKLELERKMIELDNARKTKELEEARQLQLSMLPKSAPNIPGLEICFHMQTATEVGGDYYDYFIAEDGTFTIAIGDATGHGSKAGTMVAVMKSLFVTHAAAQDMLSFLQKCSQTIRQMQFGNLYMGMSLLKLKNQTLTIASAGMPPIYIYRNRTQSVEELIIKALPLGAISSFSTEVKTLKLETGDTVLLLTDGYIELFNDQDEMLDYPRVMQYFQEVGEQSPDAIVAHLIERGAQWRNARSQLDDITFVVFKVE